MDELSEEDKLTVARARKVQRFMSQPFHVAEVFTGFSGKFVPLEETVTSFSEILKGTYDDIPEQGECAATAAVRDLPSCGRGGVM